MHPSLLLYFRRTFLSVFVIIATSTKSSNTIKMHSSLSLLFLGSGPHNPYSFFSSLDWEFLGSMLPQYMALCVSFVSCVKKKICVSICWITLWVRPPPPCENMCVRSLGYIVGASPPLCLHSIANTVGASPLVCVLSMEDNLRWILACCLLRFAAFFFF